MFLYIGVGRCAVTHAVYALAALLSLMLDVCSGSPAVTHVMQLICIRYACGTHILHNALYVFMWQSGIHALPCLCLHSQCNWWCICIVVTHPCMRLSYDPCAYICYAYTFTFLLCIIYAFVMHYGLDLVRISYAFVYGYTMHSCICHAWGMHFAMHAPMHLSGICLHSHVHLRYIVSRYSASGMHS